jgi:hypothetical protein
MYCETRARPGRKRTYRGGDPLYLSHWMRQSGLADLLPSLRQESVYVGDQTAVKVVGHTVEVVSEGHWKLFTP